MNHNKNLNFSVSRLLLLSQLHYLSGGPWVGDLVSTMIPEAVPKGHKF